MWWPNAVAASICAIGCGLNLYVYGEHGRRIFLGTAIVMALFAALNVYLAVI